VAPFGGGGLVQTLAAVLKGQVVPPRQLRPELPADLEAVLLRCLTADRARRCPSAAALADDLERLARGEGSPALAARRRRGLTLAGLVTVGVALLGAGVAALLLARPRAEALPGATSPVTTRAAGPDASTASRQPPRPARPARPRAELISSAAATTWVRRDDAPRPGAHWCTALVRDPRGGELYLFGGRSRGQGKAPLGELWSWNGERWAHHTKEDGQLGPEPRFGHAMAWDEGRGCLVLVGGATGDALVARYGTVWELDGDGWSPHEPIGGPGPRTFHGLAYVPELGRVLLFGGGGETKHPHDDRLWSWDGAAWSKLPRTGGAGPSPRHFVGIMWDPYRHALFVAGGAGSDGGPAGQELWRWRPAEGWSACHPLPRGARELPLLAPTPGGLLLFAGGAPEEKHRNDLWRWREGEGWTPLLADVDPELLPPRRRYASLAYDPGRNVLVLFGGESGDALGDLWELTPRE